MAAAALADAKGIQALTMRRLATDLGVEAMSLYHHLPGKEALLDGLVDHVVGEIDAAVNRLDSRETDSDWRPRLRQRFLAAREVMLRHPWAPGLIGTRSIIPAGLYTYYDGIVGSLIDAGFTPTASRTGRCTRSTASRSGLRGVRLTSAGGSLEAETAEAEFATIAEALPHLTAMMSAEAHDVADPTLGWCDSQIEFEFTLDLLLDGLERLPQSRLTPHSPRAGLVRRRVEPRRSATRPGQRDRVSGGRCGRRRRLGGEVAEAEEAGVAEAADQRGADDGAVGEAGDGGRLVGGGDADAGADGEVGVGPTRPTSCSIPAASDARRPVTPSDAWA